jgi:glutamate-ammonia-ligase adenylyltransferase
MQQDRQTHDLPPYEHGQDQLTQAMGEPSWDALCSKIQAVRDGVAHYFETAVASEVPAEDDMPEPELKPSNELDTYIQKWAQQDLTDEARDRLDKILPQLQAAVAAQTVVSLEAALEWIDTVVTRSAYLVLLLENAGVIQCVLEVFALSELFKVQIMQHPVLLEAFTAEHFGQPQSKADMAEALSTAMASIDVDDIEQHMETLRYFKLRMHLNIAVADVRGELPIMNVSDHLTWLAEVIVAEVERISFAAMAKRYGYPEHCDENQHGFAVIAYGKLGGIELSYRSDLDVVFLYAQAKGDTQGEKSLHHGQFYARVGQRMLHIMQTPTHLGMLYEPDMRLRPSGSAGLLVSSFEAFEDYQANKAWTWEHQSLVRARGVCGDAAVIKQFENLRMKQLGLKRECAAVAKDVVGMRDKMRANQKLKRAFDIKKSTGGLVDIEFMVQFLVLAHAHDHKGLMTYTDNIRILEAAAGVQLVHAKTAKNIIAIYQEYRYALHQRMLTRMDMRDYAAEFAPSREVVANLWSKLFEASVS